MTDQSHRYGQYPGHYPSAASLPPIPGPSPGTQHPYFYSMPQAGPMSSINYAASQNAYDNNSTRIPGLGLGGTPVAPIPSFPSAAPPMWPAGGGRNSQMNSYFQAQQQEPVAIPQHPPAPHQESQNTLEEGELGESEFEDLYEPRTVTNAPQTSPPGNIARPPPRPDSRHNSSDDIDGSSIYDPHDPHVSHQHQPTEAASAKSPHAEQEYMPDDEWEPSNHDRERSGSYSPYLSPREVHRKVAVSKAVSKATNRVDLPPSTSSNSTSTVVPPSNSIPFTPPRIGGHTVPTPSTSHEPPVAGSSPFRSPLEAKKKAQEAILGLWPLKVRYQDYIDEGVDADVVKTLFKAIGLDVPVPKTNTAPVEAVAPVQAAAVTAVAPSNISKPQSPPTAKTQAPPIDVTRSDKKESKDQGIEVKAAGKTAAEERKDKIARKLAAMAQKTIPTHPAKQGMSANTPVSVSTSISASAPLSAPVTATVPAPAPAPAPAPTPIETSATIRTKSDATATPPATNKTRAENNLILQQKLAALKKQQAQLAAEKARTAPNENVTTVSSSAASPIALDKKPPSNSAHSTSSTPSAHRKPNHQNDLPNDAQPKADGIPGLSLPSLSASRSPQGPARNLKRPVASDFDNYTPRFEPLKRTRTEKLIIDVSDDEDIEMEIGSPIEELPPSIDSSTAPIRQTPGALPPLSDGPAGRRRESPAASSAPTPPLHGTRIDLLHKRIEETKRQIAEAEAKKAAKKTVNISSPKPSSPAPQPPSSPSVAPEGNTEGRQIVKMRRDRIVSYELPRVSATIKEKQDKLKLLAAQAAQLELEVQASLEEQQKLTVEMEYFIEAPLEISPEPESEQQQQLSQDSKYADSEPGLPGQNSVSQDQQEPQGEGLGEPQPSDNSNHSLENVIGDIDTVMVDSESISASILTPKDLLDREITNVEIPSIATDTAFTMDRALAMIPDSVGKSAQVQPPTIETEQTFKTFPTDAEVDVGSVGEAAPDVPSISSSESDAGSSESDVSMQQSIPEISQSDDESYEPTPTRIPDAHDEQRNEQNMIEVMKYTLPLADDLLIDYQVTDDVPENPNPNLIIADQIHQESQNTSNEVKSRSDAEPLLLTMLQDVQRSTPSTTEDLLSYQSPLSYFHAYRFHPNYFEEVPGGLKSMTFSAKIDPLREVCSQVLAGEPCPKGAHCEYQHFDSMVLSEAEIITQLGSADMFVGETKTKFVEGLKRVLNELKANRIKDFDRITRAIVKHRQDFLGDKTKVLALDSSAI